MKEIKTLILVLFIAQCGYCQNGLCFTLSQTQHSTNSTCWLVGKADFNNDGREDVCYMSNAIDLLLSNNSGSYTASVPYPFSGWITNMAIDDFNNDGNTDLAATCPDSNWVFLFFGTGTGSFSSMTKVTVPGHPQNLVTADFNNDNKVDMATANSDSSVSILMGNANGSFLSPVNYTLPGNPQTLVCSDFNNNAIPDLFVTGTAASTMFRGTGNGQFITASGINIFAFSATTAKINSDNYPDLIYSYGGTVSIQYGNGIYGFGPATNYPAGDGPIYAADFNNDGKLDISSNAGFSICILPGNGNGTFASPSYFTNASFTNICFTYVPVDINNDNKLDFAFTRDNTIFLNFLLNCNTAEVGIEDQKNDPGIILFPNPVKDRLTLSFQNESAENNFKSAEVHNNLGQVVQEFNLSGSNKSDEIMDVKDLPDGVYTIRFIATYNGSGNQNFFNRKFVVVH